MELVELTPLSGALVGIPGVDGLSTEQRKRLTIAVELVANPSIVFMDEPTSGLDARSAAIVMRTVRNIVDTGRTIVCTIHQPSIDIFESFDEVFACSYWVETIHLLVNFVVLIMKPHTYQSIFLFILLSIPVPSFAAFVYEARRRAYLCWSTWFQFLQAC